jgi:hypothetical protein
MAHDSPFSLPLFGLLACLVALWVVAAPVHAADLIYTYTDDEGVPHFTDQWQLIPAKYRSRIQQLDPYTGKPLKPESGNAVQAPAQNPPQRSVVRKEQGSPSLEEQPFYTAWIEQFSKLSIPVPSRLQLGIGLMSIVLVFGAIKITRISMNPFLKLALKGAIMAILIGGGYIFYVASLSERISKATQDPLPQRITGKEIIDATVGKALRTRDLVNQSIREKEKALNKTEPGP